MRNMREAFRWVLFAVCVAGVLHAGEDGGPKVELNPHYGGFGVGYLTLYPDGRYGGGEVRSPNSWPSFAINGVYYGRLSNPLRWSPKVYTNRQGTTFNADLYNAGGMTVTGTFLFPKATLLYSHASLPVQVSAEVFCTLTPGDTMLSSLPTVLFDFTLRNSDTVPVDAAIAFPVPYIQSGGELVVTNTSMAGIVRGTQTVGVKITVQTSAVGNNGGAFIGWVRNDGPALTSWGTNFSNGQLSNTSGNMVASRITLAPGEERHIVFAFVWHFPDLPAIECSSKKHWYTLHFSSGEGIASYLVNNYPEVKGKVDRWFNRVMNSNLPQWMKTQILINNEPLIGNSILTSDGKSALLEGADMMFFGTYDHQFYLSIGQLMFVPHGAWGTIRHFAVTQSTTGGIRHDAGPEGDGNFCARATDPGYMYPGCYPCWNAANMWGDLTPKWILNTWHNFQWTGWVSSLTAVWPHVQEACRYMIEWDTDGDGLMNTSHNTYDQAVQQPENMYDNTLAAAAFRAAAKIAEVMGDSAKKTLYEQRAVMCSAAMEVNCWDAANQRYKAAANDSRSMSGVLAGQWYADFLYLGDILDPQRVRSTLQYVFNRNYRAGSCTFGEFDDGGTWNALPLGHYCALSFTRDLPAQAMTVANQLYDVVYNRLRQQWGQPLGISNCTQTNTAHAYMNPPVAWHLLAALMGSHWDIPNRTLWIQPHVSTAPFNRQLRAPLLGALAWGYVEYSEVASGCDQELIITMDTPTPIARLKVKATGNPAVSVVKAGVPVACTVAVSTREYTLQFVPDLVLDSTPVVVRVGTSGGGQTATRIVCAVQPATMAADGVSIATVTANVCDAGGAIVLTATHTVTFSVSGPGVLVGSANVAAVNGQATVRIRSTVSTGTITVTASATGLTPGQASVTTYPRATHIACNASPAAMYADAASTVVVRAFLRDASSATVTQATDQVTFAIMSGSGYLLPPTVVNAVNGVATVYLRSDNTVGDVTVRASAAGLTPGTVTVAKNPVPGRPYRLSVSASTGIMPADGVSAATVTARVYDYYDTYLGAYQGMTWLYRVNCGSGAYTDGSGNRWIEDTGYTGGTPYYSGAAIAGTADDPLYQSNRYGATTMRYEFDVDNGTYTVQLHFAELYHQTAGARVFDVMVEGVLVLDDFDIFAAAGARNTAVIRTFDGIVVSDGKLTITIPQITADLALFSALAVGRRDLVGFSVSGPGVIVGASSSTMTNGIAQCRVRSTLTAGTMTVTASAFGMLPGSTVIVTSGTAGAPVRLLLSVSPAGLPADGASTATLVARVCDTHNNTVSASSATVSFAVISGGGAIIGGPMVQAVGGVASVVYRSGASTGTVVIGATSPGLSSATVVVTLVSSASVPVVTLVQPADGTVFTAPATIGMTAQASVQGGEIARVEFYAGATMLAQDSVSPYTYTWGGVGPGTFQLSARAYDTNGVMAVSSTVAVSVQVSTANVPPQVSITVPSAGSVIPVSAPAGVAVATDVVITAAAADSDGVVVRVEFYAGAVKIGDVAAAPYSVVWRDVGEGNWTVYAVAYDNQLGVSTSAPVSFSVIRDTGVPPGVEPAPPVPVGEVRVMGSAAGYTNPALGDAVIFVNPRRDGTVRLTIYTLNGAAVRRVHSSGVRDSVMRFTWDGKSDDGALVPSGIYIVHVTGSGLDVKRKIAVVRK